VRNLAWPPDPAAWDDAVASFLSGPSAVNWSNPGGCPPWGTLVESGNPRCRGCGVRLLTLGWHYVDEVTGGRFCGGDPGTWDQSHRSGPPPQEVLALVDETP
jgi:hypothetical protein